MWMEIKKSNNILVVYETHLHHHLLAGMLLPILHSGVHVAEDGGKSVQPHNGVTFGVLLRWNILLQMKITS